MVRAISDNNDGSTIESQTEFTADTASKMLPLVRRISGDLVRLNEAIEAQRAQIREIDELPDTIDQPDYREELSDIRGSISRDEQQLEACMGELSALGLRPHLPIDGSIDFPATINRRPVHLCWNSDEERVEYWHEIGASNQERKKVGGSQASGIMSEEPDRDNQN